VLVSDGRANVGLAGGGDVDVIIGPDGKPRCAWAGTGDSPLVRSHDKVWSTRTYDESALFDVYAAAGTFAQKHKLAEDLARAVMRWEGLPPIPLFLDNTAAFVHDLPADAISNAAGAANYVRVQVLTPVNVLNRAKQLGVVKELTEIIAAAAGDPAFSDRTWVLITESREADGASTDMRTPMRRSQVSPALRWRRKAHSFMSRQG
jgi:phenylpyruvate tautomerase PptA (4-oxalocrotonate tautomerase family)